MGSVPGFVFYTMEIAKTASFCFFSNNIPAFENNSFKIEFYAIEVCGKKHQLLLTEIARSANDFLY